MLAVIALMVALTSSHGTFLSRMLARAELEHLYSVCYYLQRKALMQHAPQRLSFDRQRNSYTACGKEYRLPKHVQFGTAPGVKGPPSSPSLLVTRPITFTGDHIMFHPDGIMQSGTIYLTDIHRSCSYALSCAVSPVSYLRKYQYTDAWHLIS